jgi:hypothetical protein
MSMNQTDSYADEGARVTRLYNFTTKLSFAILALGSAALLVAAALFAVV